MVHTKGAVLEALSENSIRKILNSICYNPFFSVLIDVLNYFKSAIKAFDVRIFFVKGFMMYVLNFLKKSVYVII